MREYILPGYNAGNLVENIPLITDLYNEYGVVIFPGFFRQDIAFQRFTYDLSRILDEVIHRHTAAVAPTDLGDKLVVLARNKPLDGKIVTDLGTQPNKFNSFNKVKYSDHIDAILRSIFGAESILATPQAGDTLHFFPPGEMFHRYNLPPHQDYQYLMQSPRQITFYMGLSDYREGAGGLRIWEKSHKLGILRSIRNEFGAFEIEDFEAKLQDYKTLDYNWNTGDFGLFDSLLAHSSIPNSSADHGRIVQIFRFSDINNATSRAYDYRSTCYDRRGVLFPDVHPELFETSAQA